MFTSELPTRRGRNAGARSRSAGDRGRAHGASLLASGAPHRVSSILLYPSSRGTEPIEAAFQRRDPSYFQEAFHIASTGRPGPVLVDIPKNIATGLFIPTGDLDAEVDLPGYQPTTTPNYLQIQKAAEAISASEKTTDPSRCRYIACAGDG